MKQTGNRMTILLMNQFFWPDTAATSQLLTDLARALAAQGHRVHVICGSGKYAGADLSDAPDVTIHRAPALPFQRGTAARLGSYLSFLTAAITRGLLIEKPDLVVTLTTPPLLSVLGTLLKKVRGVRHFIWEMDLYPDVAVDLDYLRANSLVTRALGAIADFSRRSADGILVLGECMRDRLLQHGVPAERLHITENWADGALIQPLPHCVDDTLSLLYSGNLGLAHDVETLRQGMLLLRDDPRFRFIFAGGGAHHRELERWCAEQALTHVAFRGYRPRHELSASLGEGDIGLVTQRPSCLGAVVPSKVYGLMAAGRPVLFIGPEDATPSRLIRKFGCGWQIPCGEPERLADLLRSLAADPAAVRLAGERAREAFLTYYDLPHGIARITKAIGAARPAPVRPIRLAPGF